MNPSAGISAGTYTVSWSAVPGSGDFEIFEFNQDPATFGTGPWPAGSWTQFKSANKTSVTVTKTQSGTWWYRVRTWMKNSSGVWVASSLSTPAVAQTVEYIAPPVVNTPTASGTGSFTISWSAVPGSGDYEVFEFNQDPATFGSGAWPAGSWTQFKSANQTSVSRTKTQNGKWWYRVRTWKKNSAGVWQCSGLSSPAVEQLVELVSPPVVHQPEEVSLSGRYTISWDPVAGSGDFEVFEFNQDPATFGTGPWPAGSWTQFKSGNQTSVNRTASQNGTWWYRVRTWKLASNGQWIHSNLSTPTVSQQVQLLQGAVNQSFDTANAEADNVNVPIFKAGTRSFRITATHPTYSTSLDNKTDDFSGQVEGPVLWWLGDGDGSSAEFRQSGFAAVDDYYPTENPPVGVVEPINQCPKGLGAGGVQELRFRFTPKPGCERNNLWRFVARAASVTGTLEVRIFYFVKRSNGGDLRIDVSPGITVSPTQKNLVWVFGPTAASTMYRHETTDEVHFGIKVYSATAGASLSFDDMRLEVSPRFPNAMWSVGTNFDQPTKFKSSGFSNNDVYYVEDFPAAGIDELSTECPRELNDSTIQDQQIRFTTLDGEQFFGGKLKVEMESVTGTLAVRAKLWNGTGWTDLGRRMFTPTTLKLDWDIGDYAFLEGVDANQIWLDVETAAEGGPSSPGAKGVYDQIVFVRRDIPVLKEEFTLYEQNGVTIRGIRLNDWWRGPLTGMTVNVTGGLSRSNLHFIQVHKSIFPGGPVPQVFVLYQDGGARVLPFQKNNGVNDWIPFTSTVMFGPAVLGDRPYVDVSSLTVDPLNLSMAVNYRNGDSANVKITPASDRSKTEVDVTNLNYDVDEWPFAILRSMWVRDGNSDCDTIQTQAGQQPILGNWQVLDGQWWMFKRLTPSIHNTQGPDIRIDVTQ